MVALLLVLAANFLVVAQLARDLGLTRWSALGLGPAIALVVIVTPPADRLWRWSLPVGVALVLVPLALVGVARGGPWTAWAAVASRPALTFGEHSAWVTDGRVMSEGTTLAFDEVHRVVAGAPTTLRVVERDGGRAAVREWRLAAGDGLTLRPGDEVTLEGGTPVRFEAGRRIPGAPPSGPAWADGGARPSAAIVAGMGITIVVGALALVPAVARPLAGVPAMWAAGMLLAFVLGGAVWGVYGIALVPEMTLPPRDVVSLAELARSLGIPPAGGPLPMVVAAGLLVLFAGAALAWRARFTELARGLALALGRPAAPRFLTTVGAVAVVMGAAGLAAHGGDPWRLFTVGLGIAAACAAAPRLARAQAGAEAAGAIVGAIALVAALVLAEPLGPAFAAVHEYPAVAAAPLAWLIARLARE